MKIAIHHRRGSFSYRWIDYCKENDISYKIVNAYDNDIVQQVDDCSAFMWHHTHSDYRDRLFAKQLIYSLEIKGLKVFPDFCSTWHFDDKVGQKYLLEAVGAPLVPTYIFYNKKKALEWANQATFPKVFKLRTGAGSANVALVPDKKKAVRLIRKAFGKGFSQFNRYGNLKERIRRYKEGKDSLMGVYKGIGRLFVPTELAKMVTREKGYIYFQDYIANNLYDIRVVVVLNKAFAIKRLTRKNDFRASGSGMIMYDKDQIDERCVQIALEVNKRLRSQCTAYDFVFDANNNPLLLEISYGFAPEPYDLCEGYWDESLNWHDGPFNPYGWMVDLVK